MWRGYNEDWERRKEYLIRTLFRDISPLSTVFEEEGDRSGSSIHLSPSSVKVRRLSDAEHGTWSPLPPLIVEREPNRHDEPEEHYQRLERKMRRLYKWLFIENHSLYSSFDEYSTDENSDEFPSVETLNKTFIVEDRDELGQRSGTSSDFIAAERDPLGPTQSSTRNENEDANKTVSSSDKTLHSSIPSEDDHSNAPETYTDEESNRTSDQARSSSEATVGNISKPEEQEHSKRLSFRSASSASSECGDHNYYEQVTFRADVHREALVEDEVISDFVYEKPVIDKNNGRRDYDEVANLDRNFVSDLPFPRTEGAASNYLDVEEIEEMRTPRNHGIRTSFGTSQNQSHQDNTEYLYEKFDSPLWEVSHPFELIREDSNITMSDQCSGDLNKTLQGSTQRLNSKRQINDETIADYTHPLTPSRKRRRYENAAVQVNERTEWNSVRANFFVGTPKVFRLCSCKVHRCLC